jgi:hypothetical protein
MTGLTSTRHAEVRLSQRALRDADIAFLMGAATPLARNEWLLTNADVDREVAKHKREIQRIERLRGVKVVVAGDVVVTAYHSCQRDQRRTLRRGRHAR